MSRSKVSQMSRSFSHKRCKSTLNPFCDSYHNTYYFDESPTEAELKQAAMIKNARKQNAQIKTDNELLRVVINRGYSQAKQQAEEKGYFGWNLHYDYDRLAKEALAGIKQ